MTDARPLKKPRIVVASPGNDSRSGGISRMVSYFLHEMKSKERPFEIWALDTYGPSGRIGMPLYFARSVILLFMACWLERIDLAHIHISVDGSVLRKLTLLCVTTLFNKPVLLHFHGGPFPRMYEALPTCLQQTVRNLMLRAKAIIVLGDTWRDYVINTLGYDPDCVIVLPNAVPAPNQAETPRNKDINNLVFLGYVTEDKGMSELLEALADERMQEYNWHVKVAGSGNLGLYRTKAQSFGLQDRVEFLGQANEQEVQKLLTEGDILVLPSKVEALPMAVLESMSYGLCIIATPVGAIPEAVMDGWNGFLVPVRDSQAIATALIRLIKDPDLKLRMQCNSRQRFLEKFEISAYVDRLAAIYEKFSQK